ncbi:filamentous hemagglutinin N-terminal domain-containing protein [Sphingosinicella terrae]|uniref:two-partner secretion domain-containing protein n=1 Tax=Sphingosinicella terrae TaxID=2172047 RepID=UPI000E0D3D48|nr:filamentous hemagglutinin N-terminal domain-containing protein [Sphingosinicella terrae]
MRPATPLLRLLLAGASLSTAAAAQVAPDPVATRIVADTLPGRSLGTSVSSAAGLHEIDGGTLAGRNLFHSFSHFDLAAGETARWVRSGGSDIANVISRVTGGEASLIHGTLDSTALPNADFWFINPAGIVLGEGARLDVPAAAHFSTARELRFADGSAFTVTTPGGSTFSMAAPESFGFVGGEGDIAVRGVGVDFAPATADLSYSAANLFFSAVSLQTASLNAAAIGDGAGRFDPAAPPMAGAAGRLAIAGGSELVATGAAGLGFAAGTFTVAESGIVHRNDGASGSQAPSAPAIRIAADSVLFRASAVTAFASGEASSAEIIVQAGTLRLVDTSIVAAPIGTGVSGPIQLLADRLVMAGSVIAADSFGDSAAGVIGIVAGEMEMTENSAILADAFGSGQGGLILIEAESLRLDASNISSAARPGSTGNAGGILIEGGSVELSRGSRILSDTASSGDAGIIAIEADALRIAGGSQIATLATAEATGAAGLISLAAGTLVITEAGSVSSDTEGSGDAGGVLVEATDVEVSGGGRISSESRACLSGDCGAGGGDAGGVMIIADRLRVAGVSAAGNSSAISTDARADGGGGEIMLDVRSIVLADGASVSSDNFGSGAGGAIDIDAETITIESAQISSGAFGPGSGGTIRIDTEALASDNGRILAQSSFLDSGPGGSILVRADDISLTGESQITTSSFGSGDAGAIEIMAGRLVADGFSMISSDSFESGNGGPISITADEVRLTGAFIFAEALGFCGDPGCRAGDAGDIIVDAGTLILAGARDEFGVAASRISSSTLTNGEAGDITIRAQRVEVGDSQIFSQTQGAGNAGTIDIESGDLTLARNGRISTSSAYVCSEECGPFGQAGDVRIAASGSLILGIDSEISSNTSGFGDAGAIDIEADSLRIDGGRIETQADFGSAGDGGNVEIRARDFAMEFGLLSSRSDGTGAAGRIAVTADTLRVDRRSSVVSSAGIDAAAAGTIELRGGDVRVDNFAFVSSSTLGSAGGGDVLIAADSLFVGNFSEIVSSTSSLGDAGGVFIEAGRVELDLGGVIGSEADTFSTGGNAGVIELVADELVLRRAGSITSSTLGPGDAGLVVIDAGTILIDNGRVRSSSEAEASGISGEVLVNAERIDIVGGGSIETISRSASPAGAIAVAADRLTLDGSGSSISSANLSSEGGDAGLVLIKSEALTVANGAEISTSSVAGAAGDIEIAMSPAGLLRLEGRSAPGLITTSSGPGTGGRIIIANPLAIVSNGGSILALGEQGGANVQIQTRFFISSADRPNLVAVDGAFLLEAQVGDVSSGTVERNLSIIDASGVLRGQCAAVRETGQVSQLVVRPIGPYGAFEGEASRAPSGCL